MSFYMLDNPNVNWPQGVYPRRGGTELSGTCIIHTSQGYGLMALGRLCSTRTSYGCYHTVFDNTGILEMYPYEWETWQDSETNPWAVGLSFVCKAEDWLSMDPDVRHDYLRNGAKAAADFVIYMREVKGITVPLRRLTGAEARARVPGFCAHGDSGLYRSDPGKDFDWDTFFEYTRQELEGESEMSQEMVDAIVHRVNTFTQTTANEKTAVIVAEVRAHTLANTNRVLDALKLIPEIPDTFIEDLRAKLEQELEEATSNLEITLKASPPVVEA